MRTSNGLGGEEVVRHGFNTWSWNSTFYLFGQILDNYAARKIGTLVSDFGYGLSSASTNVYEQDFIISGLKIVVWKEGVDYGLKSVALHFRGRGLIGAKHCQLLGLGVHVLVFVHLSTGVVLEESMLRMTRVTEGDGG